jgi:hypothetical protein
VRVTGFEYRREPITLGPLLRLAVKEKAIVAETLPAWGRAKDYNQWFQKRYNLPSGIQLTSAEWMQRLIENIPNFRNRLAHGNPQLYLEASFRQLETCSDLINQLFTSPAQAASS